MPMPEKLVRKRYQMVARDVAGVVSYITFVIRMTNWPTKPLTHGKQMVVAPWKTLTESTLSMKSWNDTTLWPTKAKQEGNALYRKIELKEMFAEKNLRVIKMTCKITYMWNCHLVGLSVANHRFHFRPSYALSTHANYYFAKPRRH